MSIEVVDLCKSYDTCKAVDHISFKIEPGEIVGFLGPNGAGKSTTIKILTSYLKADSGMAKIHGLHTDQYPIETKKLIGYLPESNPLYVDMMVKEYLSFIAHVHQIKKVPQQMDRVIEATGLTSHSKQKIASLSKGYKQRVGLASAMIHNPAVLILDEPTSGLDPNQVVDIRNLIKEEGKNKTVLFSSHILQEVEAVCNRIIIIHKGKIVANNSLSNLQNETNSNHIVIIQLLQEVAVSFFETLPQVKKVISLSAPFSYELHSTAPQETKQQLIQLATTYQWNIVALYTKAPALEDMFHTLTQS